MIKRSIFVTFQKAGFHRYPQASSDPNLADVSYLGSMHRHLFKFRVEIEVFHNDREIEFHQFLNWIEGLFVLDNGALSVDAQSCEMIALDLLDFIKMKYPYRNVKIEVSEDGECGAVIEHLKDI